VRTYHSYSAHEYIVTGFTGDDDVYYEFGYLGSSGVGGFSFTYPKADKPLTDAIVERTFHSFDSGAL
jgi:hypothetical protein